MIDKRGIIVFNAFQKIIPKGHRPDKIWVEQGGEFYNKFFKSFFNLEMYSTYNEGKSVFAERYIRTLENKILSTKQLFQRMFILMC